MEENKDTFADRLPVVRPLRSREERIAQWKELVRGFEKSARWVKEHGRDRLPDSPDEYMKKLRGR